ncbi:hypothetical protein ACFXAF_13875 [Kitasatospora sp. NPDC059463]|uniref:hypothetical protein n=1 Tax=unclassified Kitasatospora TaxID=2633591 RepID=UPI0036CAB025
MTSIPRRPLWRPFSEPATDEAIPAGGDGARLLAVERAPFLEPAADLPARQPASGGRRRLGRGALADPAESA